MERSVPRSGGQEATISAVVAALIFVGTFVAYYYMLLKPKNEEIARLESTKATKITDLQNKLKVIKEQKNYEVRLAVLHDQWDENRHWFVNGEVDWTNREEVAQTQFEIFELYNRLVDIGRAAGIDVDDRSTDDHVPFQIKIDETIKFYIDDDPYDIPTEYAFLLENLEFDPGRRFPESADGSLTTVTTEGKSLFDAHNFTVQFEAPYEIIGNFTKLLQQRFGEEDTIVAVHCVATTEDPKINPIFSPFTPVKSTVRVPVQMYATAYSVYDVPNITINTPPSLPGETDCKAQGGGGGGGGGGGRGGGGGGGGGLSLGGG